VSLSPDGHSIASGSYTGKINVFNLDNGKKDLEINAQGKFSMSVKYSKAMILMF